MTTVTSTVDPAIPAPANVASQRGPSETLKTLGDPETSLKLWSVRVDIITNTRHGIGLLTRENLTWRRQP